MRTSPAKFVLNAPQQAAEGALGDRIVFTLEKKAWDAFVARLDAKAQPNARLHKTLKAALPWALKRASAS